MGSEAASEVARPFGAAPTRPSPSTARILDAASRVVACNAGRVAKNLHTRTGAPGGPVLCVSARDVFAEAAYVALSIAKLQRKGVALSEIAVLGRVGRPCLGLVERELIALGVPCQCPGAAGLLDRKPVSGEKRGRAALPLLVLLRVLLNYAPAATTPPH